jgi:hypothetical protein
MFPECKFRAALAGGISTGTDGHGVKTPVEICLDEEEFSGLPKNEWVYDDFQTSQPRVQCGRANG